MSETTEKKSRFPDSFVLIFGMIVLAQLLTYVLPHGAFDTQPYPGDPSKEMVVPGTYHHLEGDARETLHPFAFLTAIPKGLAAAQDIIFLVFLVGGVIAILRKTGAIDALLFAAVRRFGNTPSLLIAICLLMFGLGSFVIGMGEEYMPLIPMIVSMCLAMKMDSIVAMGIVWVPYAIGWGTAGINPFGLVVAQNIAGLPPHSGLGFRWVLLFLFLAIGFQHVYGYARRILKNPEASFVAHVDYSAKFPAPADVHMNRTRALVLAAFVAGVVLFVWKAHTEGWFIDELNAVFLGIGLVAAIVARMSPNETGRTFIEGAAEMTSAALLVGFARTIQVVLDDGQIIHTIVHGVASVLEGFGADVAAVGMLLVQTITNFFIPSGSGQAYVTMPVMTPLADLTGVPRQVAVLAYQFGDGFTNMVIPTNALVMGTLALGGIPYGRWVRFVLPLIGKLLVVAVAVLVFAVHFGDRVGFT